jgi:putative membrane protein insertion efficiency factor
MNQALRSTVAALLRAYKWAFSPLLPPACRYVPTCSEYAMEAVDRYGVVRGGWMAAWRVLRCHPLVKGGFDPVPQDYQSATRTGATDLRGFTRI